MLKSVSLIALGGGLGVLFLAVALAFVDVPALLGILAHTDLAWVLTALACVCLYVWIKAVRWRLLLAPVAEVRAGQALQAVFAGNAVNFVVPHLGDLVRVWMVGVSTQSKGSPLLASVAVERIIDFASMCLLAALILLPQVGLAEDLRTAIRILAVLTAALAIAAIAFILRSEQVVAAIGRVLRIAPHRARDFILTQLRQSLPGLDSMRAPGIMLRAFTLSVLIWVLIGGCAYASMKAVGIDGSLAVTTAVVLLNVVGLILPAAPGHVGTIQLAFVIGMRAFGTDAEPAFAASVVYNFAMLLPVMLVGLPSLWRAGLHLLPILRGQRA